METSIAYLVFGILSAIFLAGVVIIIHNIIKIKRSGNDWRQKLKENTTLLMPVDPELKNKLISLITRPDLFLQAPEHT